MIVQLNWYKISKRFLVKTWVLLIIYEFQLSHFHDLKRFFGSFKSFGVKILHVLISKLL